MEKYREFDVRIIILGAIILILGLILIFVVFTKKELKIIYPKGGEKFEAGKTVTILWKSRKIGKVDIYLISEGKGERMMIAEGVSGKKFDWKISFWQQPRDDYKIEILEHTENIEKYYDQSKIFKIVGPTIAFCEELSIPEEWHFIPSDYPDLKRVFITRGLYSGNLGGLDGADQICQKEAEAMGLEGKFKALLGDENISAKERLNLEGIFVEIGGDQIPGESSPFLLYWKNFKKFLEKNAGDQKENYLKAYQFLDRAFNVYLEKIEEKKEKRYCYRLLGKTFDDFFKKITDNSKDYLKWFFGESFEKDLEKGVWIGRIYPETKKECLQIPYLGQELKFSFTTSCQNWSTDQEKSGEILKECYDSQGRKWPVSLIGGISILSTEKGFSVDFGTPCNSSLALICVEQ